MKVATAWRAFALVACGLAAWGCGNGGQSTPTETRGERTLTRFDRPRANLPARHRDEKPEPRPYVKPITWPRECNPELFNDDELQDFYIEIDPASWANLKYEHDFGEELAEAGA